MSTETPDTAEETALRELFAELLEIDPGQVGLEDDFFHLGGHSQLAVRLAVRVRNRLGVKLSVADVFAAPTVAALAGRLATAPKAAAPIRRAQPREASS
jgi:acyl carrier protein